MDFEFEFGWIVKSFELDVLELVVVHHLDDSRLLGVGEVVHLVQVQDQVVLNIYTDKPQINKWTHRETDLTINILVSV